MQLKSLESELEVAIEMEEYEDAAELDDKINALTSAMNALGLSEEEKESAANMSIDVAKNSPSRTLDSKLVCFGDLVDDAHSRAWIRWPG